MIADGNIFVVGQQRIVRAEKLSNARGVMDRCVKVGVVADLRGQLHLGVAHGNEQWLDATAHLGVCQENGKLSPQR